MALSLPNNPDLDRFRRDARRLQRGVRSADQQALELVVKHHPGGVPAELGGFTLTDAQLVVARSYGFSSWPRLRHYLHIAESLRRDPAEPPTSGDPVDAYCDLACLQFSQADDPQRWLQARALLADDPELSARSVYAAATAGDRGTVAAHLAADPSLAYREGGPFHWSPLVSAGISRLLPGPAGGRPGHGSAAARPRRRPGHGLPLAGTADAVHRPDWLLRGG